VAAFFFCFFSFGRAKEKKEDGMKQAVLFQQELLLINK